MLFRSVLYYINVSGTCRQFVGFVTPHLTQLNTLFHCSMARATWFQLPLGIRTHNFNDMSLADILLNLWEHFDENEIALSMSVLWHIWKARCARIHGNKDSKTDCTICAACTTIQSIPLTGYDLHMLNFLLQLTGVPQTQLSMQHNPYAGWMALSSNLMWG